MVAMTQQKAVKNAVLFHDANGNPLVRLDKVRLSYCFVGTPGQDEDDDGNKTPSWRSDFLLPKETHLEAKNLMKEAILSVIPKDQKVPQSNWCMFDGDDKEDDIVHGHWIVRAKDAKVRPTCRDGRGQIITEISEIDRVFYSGAWANVLVRPWYFGGTVKGKSKVFPKRVPAGLTSLFFFKNDKPFGTGRIDDSDAWAGAPAEEGTSAHDGMNEEDPNAL